MAELIKSDLEFILQQILIAEAHAAGTDLRRLLPNELAMFGLRTVDGSYNNLRGRASSTFGAADPDFPRLLDPVFQAAQHRHLLHTNVWPGDRLAAAHDLAT